jgi:hypothetical protein
MFDHSGQQIGILTSIWWCQKSWRDLAANKQRSQRCHVEWFHLKKLDEIEGKEQYRVEVSSRFAALEDLNAEVGVNSAWDMIRDNIKISAKESLGHYELKKHKPWFYES